jgi:hypothetical protein
MLLSAVLKIKLLIELYKVTYTISLGHNIYGVRVLVRGTGSSWAHAPYIVHCTLLFTITI